MGIARVKYVKGARKDQGVCGGCSQPIKKGDPYKWWTVGFRARHKSKRCEKCPLPPPSARESNEKVAAVYAAQEAFDDAIETAMDRDSIVSVLGEYAEGLREAASLWNESADAIEDGFGHETEQSNEQREKGENAESCADQIESDAEGLDDEKNDEETDEDFLERLREEARGIVESNEVEI